MSHSHTWMLSAGSSAAALMQPSTRGGMDADIPQPAAHPDPAAAGCLDLVKLNKSQILAANIFFFQ